MLRILIAGPEHARGKLVRALSEAVPVLWINIMLFLTRFPCYLHFPELNQSRIEGQSCPYRTGCCCKRGANPSPVMLSPPLQALIPDPMLVQRSILLVPCVGDYLFIHGCLYLAASMCSTVELRGRAPAWLTCPSPSPRHDRLCPRPTEAPGQHLNKHRGWSLTRCQCNP